MPQLVDMAGQRYGMLTILRREGSTRYKKATWLARCDCGQEAVVIGKSVRAGATVSCGCWRRETASQRFKIYNKTNIPSGPDSHMYGKVRDANNNWHGENVTYGGAHHRVRNLFGSASRHDCVDCGSQAVHWSYQHGCASERIAVGNQVNGLAYCPAAHPDCYVPRCVPCHRKFDH